MGAISDHFCMFPAYFGVFSTDLLMKYQIFISIVDMSTKKDINRLSKNLKGRSTGIHFFQNIPVYAFLAGLRTPDLDTP